MRRVTNTLAVCAATFGMFAAGGAPANAEDFYSGKTISMIVGSSAGGSLDSYSRLVARHIGKHVPGNPTVIVQNMPGAASLITANYVYNVSKPDGLTIGAFGGALVMQQIMDAEQAKFDARKFGWLGSPSLVRRACLLRKETGIKSVEDWLKTDRPPHISGLGPGAGPSDFPRILNAAIGLPLQMLDGYKGGNEAQHALELGEVDGYCGSWQSSRNNWETTRIAAGDFVIVLQNGPDPHPDLPTVPLAVQYAKTKEAKQLIDLFEAMHGYQFVFATPPSTPDDRVAMLQTAYRSAMNDPELREEATRQKVELSPVFGETLSEQFKGLYELPQAMIDKVKAIVRPKQ